MTPPDPEPSLQATSSPDGWAGDTMAGRAQGGPGRPLGRGLLWPMLLTALGYFLVSKAALLLAIPPGYASPLYPSAGQIGRAHV